MSGKPPHETRRLAPVIGLGAGLVATAIVLALTPGRPKALILGGLLLGAILLIGAFASVAAAAQRRRREGIVAACSSLGLEHVRAKSLADRGAAFAPFAHLKMLRTGAKGLDWIARDPSGADPLTIFEHSFVVSTGKSSTRITHTAAALPCPASWPALSLTPEHLGHKIAGAFGKRDAQLEDAEFNKRWHIGTDREEFALLALGPEMQSWLLETPRAATFHVGGGWLVCLERKALDGPGVAGIAELAREFLSRLPPELAAYQPGA